MTLNGSEFHIHRIALGLSNAKLAKLLGKGARTLASYEALTFEPVPEVEEKLSALLEEMTAKLEPLMALKAGSKATKTFWLYSTTEELHQAHPEEFGHWDIETYREYLAHAIVILKLKKISYRILNPSVDS